MKDNSNIDIKNNPLKIAIKKCNFAFKITFWFAFATNLLMLLTPLYSLQVLDRVLGSRNLNTLLMLSIIVGLIYLVYAMLQTARSFTLIKIGEWLDNNVSPELFHHSVSAAASKMNQSSSQLLRDFETVKRFLTSTGINTLFDAPWSIVYFIVVFLIHPYIGAIALLGAVLIVSFGLFNAVATNQELGEATHHIRKGHIQADIANRNAETVEAMGMMKNVSKIWSVFNKKSLSHQSNASYRSGIISNISRFVRNLMQMAVTGVGAYLVIDTYGNAMTAGNMIASSIIVGKALAPFDNAIVMWKEISGALRSYKNINMGFDQYSTRVQSMVIPNISGNLVVDDLHYALPTIANPNIGKIQHTTTPKFIIKGISFGLTAGESLAIIGPSASGKSTLAKLIVGVWKASSGVVRLDGGDVYTWNRENFGTHIGYLPQNVELFSGSVKQNIARMSEEIDPEKIVEAATISGAHEMILALPNGYDTDIGITGTNLSGGQKQRIGLARSFYGTPKLLILDEPNANLDRSGESALAKALIKAKQLQITVIVISHRSDILSVVDKIIFLKNGSILQFGSKEEILLALQQQKIS
ncbi:type I secretion system permease/ATPase [Rickettsia endosymbiont of Cardiosporidium cionae]|uniref:type I secretion system permease/ATPase n=1 Tax=Rickettsia endosymbiont of Cardiosporidium cionae TaxID=2777155 RepID=UPI00189612B9|nr:type I secretion system permease/ATPase [Rickettsia endosymbiont of Cardiosporidium cionae]KAF8818236.1 type I secretion system permease/ATPase [Rickettsia endosymbiont of Cardiosporidium cionae]